jgi:HTH-type transcriptional regulator/antitoxin HigA
MQKQFKMNIKPIKTKEDYELAMTRLETLFDAKKGTSKGDELEVLSLLIDKYENDNFPIELPDPVEAIKFRMEQLGLTQTDLARVVGQKSRASEILNRKRKLSLEMIRQLHSSWHIPTEVLVQAY